MRPSRAIIQLLRPRRAWQSLRRSVPVHILCCEVWKTCCVLAFLALGGTWECSWMGSRWCFVRLTGAALGVRLSTFCLC